MLDHYLSLSFQERMQFMNDYHFYTMDARSNNDGLFAEKALVEIHQKYKIGDRVSLLYYGKRINGFIIGVIHSKL